MAYISEIDKLEQRYRENPKGRNFAPLADAYRKAGLLDNAIELCKSGLERHPDYVSAHIVYGRCLIDQKNESGASEVFRKVVQLDPENVLGLRILAEIAERAGRLDETVEWLTRLLGADPMNGDAAEALSRAKRKAAQAPKPPEPVVERLEPVPTPDLVVEYTSERTVAPEPQSAYPVRDLETFDGGLHLEVVADQHAIADQPADVEGLNVQEGVESEPQHPIAGEPSHGEVEEAMFARRQALTARPTPTAPRPASPLPAHSPESEFDLPQVDLPLILPEDIGPAPPAPPPVPPPPLALSVTPAPPAPAASQAPAPPPSPAAAAPSDDDGAADTAALSRAEPVLTETMAELYLKQGHQEDALRVYQALLAHRPHDVVLRARVEALAPGGKTAAGSGGGWGRGVGESVPAFLKRILAGRPEPSTAVGTSPLESAFAVAPPEPEPAPEIVAPGHATRPAEDTIFLDQVFGDEGPGVAHSRAEPRSVAPSLPSSSSPSPPSSPSSRSSTSSVPSQPSLPSSPARLPGAPAASEPVPATGGFSFDQFFGTPGGPGAPTGGVSTPPPQAPPRAAASNARAPVEDEGDLDQFQAWLKGLKS